jgi:hypothetical protein
MSKPRALRGTIATVAAAAAAALAATLTVAAPAQAAGGGCNTYTRNGWNVGACSSDNGVRVSGDAYINQRGSLGSNCWVRYGIYDETIQDYVALTGKQSCYTGRHPEIHATKVPGHEYRNYVGVVVDNRTVWYDGSWLTY